MSQSSKTTQEQNIIWGWTDTSDRPRLSIKGPDRLDWLQGLTTNQVKELPENSLAETFFCNVKGRILQYALVTRLDDQILLDLEPGPLDGLITHLNKYHILEDVEILQVDATQSCVTFFGAAALTWVQSQLSFDLPSPAQATVVTVDDHPLIARQDDRFLLPTLDIIVDLTHRDWLLERLNQAADDDTMPPRWDHAQVDKLRVWSGVPSTPIDLVEQPLPQEVNRVDRTISFKKGCYLGQETVARLDARGHVNRLFRGLAFDDLEAAPSPGDLIFVGDKKVGQLTSVVQGPQPNSFAGLAFVRVNEAPPGQTVVVKPHTTDDDSSPSPTSAKVIELPFPWA